MMRRLTAIMFALWLTPSLSAHPISLSSATIDVQQKKITAEIQIMAEDLVLHHSIASDEDDRYDANELRQAAKSHRQFLSRDFILRDQSGIPLKGTVTHSQNIPDDGLPQSQLKSNTLTYTFVFPLTAAPSFITITQSFGGPKAILPSLMDCMVFQSGVLIEAPGQLPARQPFTAKFDWKNAPTKPKNLKEFKARRAKQSAERLGISSYGGLYSFLYITPHEVRHEILIPLLTLERWITIKRANPDFIDVDEQSAAAKVIGDLFRGRNPVTINGKRITPTLSRLDFFGLDINDFARRAEARRVSTWQARVGIILSYPTVDSPRAVTANWDTFNQYAAFMRSIIFVGDGDPGEHQFTKDSAQFKWAGSLTNTARQQPEPVVTGEPDVVFESLLNNVYRAFEFQTDSDVYDALSRSVDGELQRQLYLQIKRSLLMAEQGGAKSRVRGFRIVSGKARSRSADRFQYQCRWRVTGTVEHWGHIHTRVNEYDATFTVSRSSQSWKITDYQLSNQKRVRFETGLRSSGATENMRKSGSQE